MTSYGGKAIRSVEALYAALAVVESELDRPELRRGERRLSLDRLCREATRLSQVGEEVIQPWAIGHASRTSVDTAMIEWDLIRVLIVEVLEADEGSALQSSLTTALRDALARRRTAECGPDGLVATMVSEGCPDGRLAETLQNHADDLDERYRRDGWYALQPQGLETLRSSVASLRPPARCDRVSVL